MSADMTALLLDTSGSIAWIALSKDKKILESATFPSAQGLSERLHPFLATLVKDQKIDYIAVGIGPGSYAGSRTSATIAKTLAFAWNIPLVGFPTPLAFLPKDCTGSFAYIVDAKMGELALFKGKFDEGILQLLPFQLIPKSEISMHLNGLNRVIQEGRTEPHFELVASYVHDKYLRGETDTAQDLELVYFR